MMYSIRYYCLFLLANVLIGSLHAQSLSQQVVASAGGVMTSSMASLSFTVGETQTQTFTAAGHTLTQGFQQPFTLTLHLKAWLQGYNLGSASMASVLMNQGVVSATPDQTDSITIELRSATSPYSLLSSSQQIIPSNGVLTYQGFTSVGQSCYIVIKHRNHLETWSANPIALSENTIYDFTTAASHAYGDNQVEVEPGLFALYAGDINQDGFVDSFDFPALDSDIFNGVSGVYANTDLNGDGFVDSFDFPLFDVNSFNGISVITP